MTSPPAVIDEFTLLCERCGYVVDGLPPEGACPECGKPIVESLPERRVTLPPSAAWRIALSDMRHPVRALDKMAIEPSCKEHGLELRLLASAAVALWVVPFTLAMGIYQIRLGTISIDAVTNGLVAMLILLVLTWIVLEVLTRIEGMGLRFLGSRRKLRVTKLIAACICARGCAGWLAGACLAHVPLWIAAIVWITYSGIEDHGSYSSPTLPSWAWPVVEFSPLLASAAMLSGFLFFETFAWLGLRRLKYANRVRPTMPTSEAVS